MWQPPLRGTKDGDQLLLQEVAEFGTSFDGLMTGAIAESVEDGCGGWHAEVAREKSGFELVKGGLVDGASERGEIGDSGGEGLAGTRDGLAHAVEEVFFWFWTRFFGFFAAKEAGDHLLQSIAACVANERRPRGSNPAPFRHGLRPSSDCSDTFSAEWVRGKAELRYS